jgi:hypothetical protein
VNHVSRRVALVLAVVLGLSSGLGGRAGAQQVQPWTFDIPDIEPVVFVVGTPEELGVQYGRQLGPQIEFNKTFVWRQMLDQGLTRQQVLDGLARFELATFRLAPELLSQLRGIAEGARSAGFDVTFEDCLLTAAQFDLLRAVPLLRAEIEEGLPHSSGLAAIGTATLDGKPLLASTSDGSWAPTRAVVVAFPSDGNSFVAFPRLGKLTENMFLNSKGVGAVGPTGAGSRPTDTAFGVPVTLLYAYTAQRASSADEAATMIAAAERTFGQNYFFQDSSGNTVVVESNAAGYALRRPGDQGEQDWIVATNHAVTEAMRPANPANLQGSSSWFRYLTASEYLRTSVGRIDVDLVKGVQSSHDRFDGERWTSGVWENTIASHSRAASSTNLGVIMRPADQTIHVVFGTPDGMQYPNALGEYVQLSLRPTPAAVTLEAGRTAAALIAVGTEQLGYPRARVAQDLLDIMAVGQREYVAGVQDEQDGSVLERAGRAFEANVAYGKAATHYLRAQAYAQLAPHRAAARGASVSPG